MAQSEILDVLAKSFPASKKENWKATASSELEGGGDAFSKLVWQGQGSELKFFPYYDKHDLNQLHYLRNFHFSVAENSYLGARAWLNQPLITVTDESKANELALNHLRNGADGILLDLKNNASFNLTKLLEKIEWPYCSLSFFSTKESFLKSILDHAKQYTDTTQLSGVIFWDELPKKELLEHIHLNIPNFRILGLRINSSTPVKEISDALLLGVKFLFSFEEEELLFRHFKNVAFSIPVTTYFLEDISKLKVLRMLWFQIAQAFGIKNFLPSDLYIHARSEAWINETYQPHGNLLKCTTAAMASIIGGCDALTVLAEDENNVTMNRIARNVSNILREESNFNKVSDPMAGSYIIENMVHEMAQKTWEVFQSTLKS